MTWLSEATGIVLLLLIAAAIYRVYYDRRYLSDLLTLELEDDEILGAYRTSFNLKIIIGALAISVGMMLLCFFIDRVIGIPERLYIVIFIIVLIFVAGYACAEILHERRHQPAAHEVIYSARVVAATACAVGDISTARLLFHLISREWIRSSGDLEESAELIEELAELVEALPSHRQRVQFAAKVERKDLEDLADYTRTSPELFSKLQAVIAR